MLRDYLGESCLTEPFGCTQNAVLSWVEIRLLSGRNSLLQTLKRIPNARSTDLSGCGFEHCKSPSHG